jgi:ATP-dependent DNA helicase RecG
MTQRASLADHKNNSLLSLKGVGEKIATRLAQLKIYTIDDLLFHLPLRYEDRTRITPIGALRQGSHVVIQGKVELSEIKFARKRMLLCRISDGTGFITLRFFHFSASQKAQLSRGVEIRCYGEVRLTNAGLEMIHPEYQRISPEQLLPMEETLTPVYPTTEGMHQLSIRKLVLQALQRLDDDEFLKDIIPQSVWQQEDVPTLSQAIQFIHRPTPDANIAALISGQHKMQRRLIIEELIAHTLSLRQLRNQVQYNKSYPLIINGSMFNNLFASLPFKLTEAQQRVIDEIAIDVKSDVPMQRLVQGDVGSGKTIVALLAMLYAVDSGYQAVIMAPTEILAEQHFNNFISLLKSTGIKLARLSGKMKVAERKQTLEQIQTGSAQIIVGTHALFQEQVIFHQLGLVVIDEQHRFGVHQRLALWEKGKRQGRYPHQLIMTATPIPRTLSMAVYADLDISVIDTLPPGRKHIDTVVLSDARREAVISRVHKACQQGKQVYWVCTLVEESEVLQCQAAEDTALQITEALVDISVGLVPGRMKSDEKNHVMQSFKNAEIDLLVATTVIEVGVDVPNASLMIIENAERLGLSQLHQLRGRVGRGEQASACVLMYHGRLSRNATERLGIMRETNDGFRIAEKDLELRGPGEVLGTRQTGQLDLKIANLQRDQHLMPQVVQIVDDIISINDDISDRLVKRWHGADNLYRNV